MKNLIFLALILSFQTCVYSENLTKSCRPISRIISTQDAKDILAICMNQTDAWIIFDCNGVLLSLADLSLVKAVHEIGSLSYEIAAVIWNSEPVALVDARMPCIVRILQYSGYRCLLLTQRSTGISSKIAMDEVMRRNLGEYYDFAMSWTEMQDRIVLDSPPRPKRENVQKACYKDGVIYSSRSSKGEALKAFMRECKEKNIPAPSCIVFVDDKLDKIYDVQKAAVELGIKFIGVHYCRLKHMIQDVAPNADKLREFYDMEDR